VAYTDGFNCVKCGKRLHVSAGSRGLAVVAGLAAGLFVWRLSWPAGHLLGWVLPAVYSIFAFGVVTALMQMFVADLVVKEEEPEPAPVAAHSSAAHGGGHH
jgi:hypothetical protein